MFIVFRQWSEGENKQQVNYMCLYSSHMDAFLAQWVDVNKLLIFITALVDGIMLCSTAKTDRKP